MMGYTTTTTPKPEMGPYKFLSERTSRVVGLDETRGLRLFGFVVWFVGHWSCL